MSASEPSYIQFIVSVICAMRSVHGVSTQTQNQKVLFNQKLFILMTLRSN